MKLKAAIASIIAPMLEHVGYRLKISGPCEYLFLNQDGTRRINFDHNKYAKREVRVHFWLRTQVQHSVTSFYLSHLRTNFFPSIDKEDDNKYLLQLTEQIISIVIPYMDVLEQNEIVLTQNMYDELATDPVTQAKMFAEKYRLPQDFSAHGKMIEPILWAMQSGMQHRRDDFYNNLGKIINLAAYAGECMRRYNRTQWEWNEEHSQYGIGRYDILDRVAAAWTAGPEIINYGLTGVF